MYCFFFYSLFLFPVLRLRCVVFFFLFSWVYFSVQTPKNKWFVVFDQEEKKKLYSNRCVCIFWVTWNISFHCLWCSRASQTRIHMMGWSHRYRFANAFSFSFLPFSVCNLNMNNFSLSSSFFFRFTGYCRFENCHLEFNILHISLPAFFHNYINVFKKPPGTTTEEIKRKKKKRKLCYFVKIERRISFNGVNENWDREPKKKETAIFEGKMLRFI